MQFEQDCREFTGISAHISYLRFSDGAAAFMRGCPNLYYQGEQ
jgi:hypothetical protein